MIKTVSGEKRSKKSNVRISVPRSNKKPKSKFFEDQTPETRGRMNDEVNENKKQKSESVDEGAKKRKLVSQTK